MNFFANFFSLRFSNHQILASSFAAAIFIGALLLMLPISSVRGESLPFIDALFTATSAVCVTGLVVVDTGRYFSVFGQLVVIALIQIGGIGIMTGATLIYMAIGRKIDLKQRLVMQESFSHSGTGGTLKLVNRIIKYTLLIEFIGGCLLAIRFYQDFGLKGIYFGFWHSVSAFCNAGFDLLGGFRSLTGYVSDPIVSIVISTLIVLGGLGFSVMTDVVNTKNFKGLSFNSKIVVSMTLLLIVFGALLIYFLEKDNLSTLGALDVKGKILAALFQSITPRTAGFNTLDLTALNSSTIFLMIFLMFVGGSPSSTAGGLKTTTAAVIACSVWSMIRGKSETILFYRRFDQGTILKAYQLFMMLATGIIFATFLLNVFEGDNFLYLFFEVTSAFATVGLSCGLTPTFTDHSKMVLIISMFIGRVGPMTFAYALLHKGSRKVRYPEGKVNVG